MRDIELDDGFWREALGALGQGSWAPLAPAHPEFVQLLADLEAEAARDAVLIGIRLGGAEQNGRLLAFVMTAFLARAGVRALLVDLSSDLRLLEHLLEEDLKEGIVDHIQYAVPLERCVHSTALADLAVLTGGAAFLTGSALDDAPALRGTLDRLRQRYRAVVVALPNPEAADGAGITALCDAIVTVEGPEGSAVVGRERAVVRLVGNPQAAWDLARMTHRFLGPLPALLQRGGAPVARPAATPAGEPAPAAADDDLTFLAAFEQGGAAGDPSTALRIEDVMEEEAALDSRLDRPPWRPPRERRAGRRAAAVLGVVLLLGLAAWLGRRHLTPLIAGARDEGPAAAARAAPDRPEDAYRLDDAVEDGGTVVALDPGDSTAPAHSAAPATVEAGLLAGSVPEESAGRPVPYSVHVGSFQDEGTGLGVVERLRTAGHEAYLAPVDLAEKGRWHRVYVGAYGDSATAGAARARLLGDGAVQDAVVRPTPWTYALGTFPTRAAAERRREELRRQGITAYIAGTDPVRLFAGAYGSREEAAALAPTLEAGPASPILTRRGL